ncbi:hypothetical protein WJX72_000716 [[Myrmecia] bisecta]|uniref:Response regulatory domain-containing protein n=1 Tax=[Myrmecia] bisecta TaxID=41462 RepID=A0AAW1PF44_9CHLO
MTMKRVPSFSGRPGFPVGLQVMLITTCGETRAKVEQQLKQLSYEVTSCSTCSEAVATLRSGDQRFDIVLVEAKSVTQTEESQQFIQAASGLPLVLMAESGSTGEVWKGIELGAADVLEKPLSLLKLRNIWQHVVRKMMGTDSKDGTSPKCDILKMKAGSAPLSPRSILATPATTSTTDGISDSSMMGSKGCKSGDADAASVSGAPEKEGADGSIESRPSVTRRCSSLDDKSRQKSKKSKEKETTPGTVTHRPPLAIRPPAGYMPQAAGMAPSWGRQPSMQGCLKKSESFVNLINAHLRSSSASLCDMMIS